MTNFLVFVRPLGLAFALLTFLVRLVHAETITGNVYAIKGDKVLVELSATAGVSQGARVSFSIQIPGLDERVEAGTGEVDSVDGNTVIVAVSDGDIPLDAQATVSLRLDPARREPVRERIEEKSMATPPLTEYERKDYILSDPTPVSQSCRHSRPFLLDRLSMHHPGYKRNVKKIKRWVNKEIKRLNAGKEPTTDFYYLMVLNYWYLEGFDQDGIVVKPDYAEAFRLAEAAATQNNAPSAWQFNLSQYYFNGIGVEQNKAEAAKWLKKSLVEKPDDVVSELALHNMACLYLSGSTEMGVAMDRDKALQLFHQAASRGWGRSIDMLEQLGQ